MELTIFLLRALPPAPSSSPHPSPRYLHMVHMCAMCACASMETQAFKKGRKCAMFVFLNLSYLVPIISNCICFPRNNKISFFFMKKASFCIYIALPFCVGRHSGWFYSSAIVNSTKKKKKTQTKTKNNPSKKKTKNKTKQKTMQISNCGMYFLKDCLPESGIAGSCDGSSFHF